MASTLAQTCRECGFGFPPSSDRCPHCARPSLFPNVIQADSTVEKDALEQRYRAAVRAIDPNALPVLAQFENAIASSSKAVITRHSTEVFRLAANDHELYASFYELVRSTARLPSGGFWDSVRGAVDEKLFPNYKEQIRFAALTLNGKGLKHYGDCFLVLMDRMIAHRTTVFEENSIVFMQKRHVEVTDELPSGYRAAWTARGQLAVAKKGPELTLQITQNDFPKVLIADGKKPEDDDFIEAHIYGSISIRTVETVYLASRATAIRRKALREKLAKIGVPLKDV